MVEEDQTVHALRLWREGETSAAAKAQTARAAEYGRAIAAVLAELQRFCTLDELVDAWYAGRADAVLDVVCHPADGHTLNYGIVEDAAFQARWQELSTGISARTRPRTSAHGQSPSPA
jgi:hypothetical protein